MRAFARERKNSAANQKTTRSGNDNNNEIQKISHILRSSAFARSLASCLQKKLQAHCTANRVRAQQAIVTAMESAQGTTESSGGAPRTTAATIRNSDDDVGGGGGGDSDCDSDSVVAAFTAVDFSGVDFDVPAAVATTTTTTTTAEANATKNDDDDESLLALLRRVEERCAFGDFDAALALLRQHDDGDDDESDDDSRSSIRRRLRELAQLLSEGEYARMLRSSESAKSFFVCSDNDDDDDDDGDAASSSSFDDDDGGVSALVRRRILREFNRRCRSRRRRSSDGDPSSSSSAAAAAAAPAAAFLVETELLGVAAFNLFLQANYTGPALKAANNDAVVVVVGDSINPHACFASGSAYEDRRDEERAAREDAKDEEEKSADLCDASTTTAKTKKKEKYQNAVLSELAVDGEWPCQVCDKPYFLLLARSIFCALLVAADDDDDGNNDRNSLDWKRSASSSLATSANTRSSSNDAQSFVPAEASKRHRVLLPGARLWCARAAVAHERLLQARAPTATLWNEVEDMYGKSIEAFCPHQQEEDATIARADDGNGVIDRCAATVMLEWGLAQHHFNRPGMGKKAFRRAQELSGLRVEVTGAVGKRTKFQQEAKAQMLVKATSAVAAPDVGTAPDVDIVRGQMIEHGDDGILLERIKFEDDKENEISELNVLDQAILLALCLDVKNSNPADGLTREEMGACIAPVLDHHDDWMVYSTALLERAWLEFERSHARERAILQMQALADQHTERLTITQSTRESIEKSAPVQDRLKMLQCIVYPPRWSMIQDLADRYASLGIVTSAAELFVDVEMWDDAVDCYRRAGKLPLAEKIVRERLAIRETPRMWSALGDLTEDPQHYRRAIELSKGRYSDAFVALGAYYFQKGELESAATNYEQALKIRPLMPHIWFRFGTISMQLQRWDTALRAFSEVVQQEPEEAEAWANVAAVHLHNKQPAEAYPALVESLRRNRNNWRIWVSKLYTCLDLEKYDEAVQAGNVLLDLRAQRQASEGIPPLEEKCVRAIVGGTVKRFSESQQNQQEDGRNDTAAAALESSRRTLTRVSQLLNRIGSSSDAEPWVFETTAFFHESVGQDEQVILEDLMKEYRALQTVQGWEKEDGVLKKVCSVVCHVVDIHRSDGSRESLTKAKFLARGVVTKIRTARKYDDQDSSDGRSKLPEEFVRLESLLRSVDEALQSLASIQE